MHTKVYGINVVGNKSFCEQTKKALDLLKEKDHHNYKRVKKFIEHILSSKSSGADGPTKTFFVGKITAFPDSDIGFSIIWYASAIVHDAIHIEMYRRFKEADPKKIERYEKICCSFQEKCLKRLGASKRHFKYLNVCIKNRYWEKGNY